MWIIIWKNVYDSWSPWPGPRGCFGALSASATAIACDFAERFSTSEKQSSLRDLSLWKKCRSAVQKKPHAPTATGDRAREWPWFASSTASVCVLRSSALLLDIAKTF